MADTLCAGTVGTKENALIEPSWCILDTGKTYECRVLLIPEADGGFSAIAIRLPGVASQGDTEVEALTNIRDAFQAAVQVYLEEFETIPWNDAPMERPPGSKERWILVDV